MALKDIPHRHKAWFIGIGVVSLILVGGLAAAVVLLSGAYSTEATKQHFRITYRFLELGLYYSVASHARHITAPDLDRVASVQTGLACYRRYCVECHGAPGVSRDGVGMGQLPSPSSLSQTAREWPVEYLFYVTQKGVRMSGMPAWEFRISEQGLWSTVAFLQAMPFQTRHEYEAMVAQNEGYECPRPQQAVAYSEEIAHTLLRQYACDNCHQIEQLVGPKTYIGPVLHEFGRRRYIAGTLPNTHDNLVRWLVDPPSVSPATLMPNLGVTEEHARVMAQYFLGTDEG